jgi:hypothetical protein
LKFAPYVGISAALLLIIFCFMPWAYYPDIHENFNGFYSRANVYGRPGKTLLFLSVLSITMFLITKLWAKRVNQFVAVILFAYSLKTFILFSSSYGSYSPEIKTGLYGIVVFPLIILIMSLLSVAKVKEGN